MLHSRNTVKALFAPNINISSASYLGCAVYNISRKVDRNEFFVGSLVIADREFFTLNMVTATGTEVHTGNGFIELSDKLQELKLLHEDARS
jgi:hypothetical protein